MADDGPLPIAKRRLCDAVRELADPQPEWAGGVLRWSDSLYSRLRTELSDTRVTRRRQVHQSRLPCHTGILALLVEIDAAVGSWEPDGKSTVERLHQLVDRGWRPQDCSLLDDYSAQIQRWVLAGTELLDPPVAVHLPQPCPRCSEKFAYPDSAGEQVRVRALRVSEQGCSCLACGAFWGPDRFEWLARLLGCDGVLTA